MNKENGTKNGGRKQPRTIIIGDVHGCYREWIELLRLLKVTPEERLISVGDLICKGPESHAVLESAMTLPNLECVLGNHEARFLHYWKNGVKEYVKPYDEFTMKQLKDGFEKYMQYISRWPAYLDLADALVVHAGLRPGVPVEKQSLEDLTNLRYLFPDDRPWYEAYDGKKQVVFGHWRREEPLVLERAVGIDTACVYGGKLTAYILPDRKLVHVPAAKSYYKKDKA